MDRVRRPAVAGTFYPRDADELRATVRRHLLAARSPAAGAPASAKAIIAPHAGYAYSGPVAGSAFHALAASRGEVRRVLLVGPAHRTAFRGVALPEAGALATPLGVLTVDAATRAELRALPHVLESDRAHAGEHSIEVELPFVQEVLGDVSIVPLVAGDASDAEVAAVIDRAWGGPETCVVVSSDLSHYYPYATAASIDRETALAIERLSPRDVGEEQACGRVGVRALLLVAAARGLRATTLDLRSSGDTAGPRGSVVGYGAFAFA